MSDLVSRAAGRPRPLVHLPLPLVRCGLIALRSVFGEAVFATWEEAELMEVSMVSERGTADAQALGVEPRRMSDVLEDALDGSAAIALAALATAAPAARAHPCAAQAATSSLGSATAARPTSSTNSPT